MQAMITKMYDTRVLRYTLTASPVPAPSDDVRVLPQPHSCMPDWATSRDGGCGEVNAHRPSAGEDPGGGSGRGSAE